MGMTKPTKLQPIAGLFCLLFLVVVLSGCATTASSTNTGETTQNIPPDEPFAKIEKGMGQTQVFDIIGQPDDSQSRSSGKAFIPFYYGSDTVRTILYYEDQGRIVLGGNNRVIGIDYDPSEDGYM